MFTFMCVYLLHVKIMLISCHYYHCVHFFFLINDSDGDLNVYKNGKCADGQ